MEAKTFDAKLASCIDHTLLKPDAQPDEIDKLCTEALTFQFASVCVNPSYVARCFSIVKDSPVRVCTVIGFPLGATTTDVKKAEAAEALQNGASELDMVLHIGMLKCRNDEYIQNDIATIVLLAKQKNARVKVILETCLLTDDEKVRACLLAKEAGAHFVKTSTGFSKAGATLTDIALMRKTVGTEMGLKASGGIRTREQALAFLAAGATRIGTSSGVAIITETTTEVQYREY
ncbi:MAG: deoxyribose-phosphate aldolase [Bacteroidetes bacterium]|nr:deoxyribose-phosphate aldolase [Bacteroidota bacterium]